MTTHTDSSQPDSSDDYGYDLAHGPEQQKLAVETGYWPLYRFDPRRVAEGQPAMQLDSQLCGG